LHLLFEHVKQFLDPLFFLSLTIKGCGEIKTHSNMLLLRQNYH